MGTSSNFENMFSAAAAAAVLPFLPMLPSQILLNNLLYDASQLTIPTDRVDAEQLRAPSHWDLHMIRRFMLFFGPVSSLFDFLQDHAGAIPRRPGPVSLRLVRRVFGYPDTGHLRDPHPPGAVPAPPAQHAATGGGAGSGGGRKCAADFSAVHHARVPALPIGFFVTLGGLVVIYLILIELAKRLFFAERFASPARRRRGAGHRVHRRASRFTHAGRLS